MATFVLVHGGGFLIGSRGMKPMRWLATRLVESGYAVMAFDYRLIFRGGRLRGMLADVQAALQWWHGQTAAFQLDGERVYVAGLSAGATLMLLSAADWPEGTVAGLCSIFGIYDFTYLTGWHTSLLRRWLFQTSDQAVWRAHSPITVARTPVPLLLVHGTGDEMVPLGHAERLAGMRRSEGLPVETVILDGAPHAFFNTQELQPYADAALSAMVRFFGDPTPRPASIG